VRVTNLGTLDRLDAARKVLEVLADGNTVPHRPAGHPALMADPIDGAHRTLFAVLLRLAEGGRGFGELELEQVTGVPDSFQLGGKLRGLSIGLRPLAEAIDRGQQLGQVGARRRDRFGTYHNSV